ncbi:MAG: IS110 family transposase [Tenericutes bacterium]|nr:IS110 family transposase [Mycoplasmatota bacterium]
MKYGVGIDVSKGKSTVAILSIEGEVIEEPFEINHDINGLNLLEEKLKDISKEDLKIVMEETGTYHLPVLGYLLDKGYFVVAENALKIKKYLDRGLRKAKTDKKDSYKLAEYTCDNWYKLNKVRENDETYDNLRFLSRQYINNINVQIKQKNNFSNLCDLLFPGYYQMLDENNIILGLEIFKKYYHPEIVTNKKQSQFVDEIDKLAKELGHKGAGITLANKIYLLAQKTISPRPNNEFAQLSAISCADALILTIKTTTTIITEMDKLARELPEYDVISGMPGCGKKLTSRVIAEIGDVRRFKNAGSIIAYAGLDAPPYQSGQFEATNRHISKRGNKYLRKAGYEVMKSIKSSCRLDNDLKSYIIKKENEGKSKKVAKIAGLNKFLRMYYGIVKKKYKQLEIW